jgi:alkanesulfonate monooxygenase SsuD/methylene tetrahydromethanopterin reductase-like flavin-dependent oxidoreductase (luciferase family)
MDLLAPAQRFNRFEEGVEVISKLLKSEDSTSFEGEFYRLKNALLLPRPNRPKGPPIIIGGIGEKRTISIAAKYADEWNALFIPADEFRRLNSILDGLIIEIGRDVNDVSRSLMTGCIYGRDTEEVDKKVAVRTSGKKSITDLRDQGMIVGIAEEIAEQIDALKQNGVQRVMLQWLDLDDLQGLESMAAGIIQ